MVNLRNELARQAVPHPPAVEKVTVEIDINKWFPTLCPGCGADPRQACPKASICICERERNAELIAASLSVSEGEKR